MPSVKGRQPAGTYQLSLEDDEVSFAPFVWLRRVATYLHLPALSMWRAHRQVLAITSADLAAAIARDERKKDGEREAGSGPRS